MRLVDCCAAAVVFMVAASAPASGLMFHSQAVTKEWDTWVFVENNTYYAYYLVTEVCAARFRRHVGTCLPVLSIAREHLAV